MGAFRRTAGVQIEEVRGVRSIKGVPYVLRDCERDVERRLRDRRVLIVGPAMAGKTRLALQLTREIFPDHGFVDAADGTSLRTLLEVEPSDSRLVIWLDDLMRFLGDDPLTRVVLELLHSRGNVLIATMGTRSYEALTSTDAVQPFGWGLPAWFGEPVRLAGWSPGELDRAMHRGVAEQILASARRSGLSASVGGGPGLVRWLRSGGSNQPVGYALVRAAADWRGAGMSPVLARQTLVDLVPSYLNNVSAAADVDAVSNGLSWAATRVNGVALLEPHGDGYRLLDYVHEHLAAEASMIPQPVWDTAIARALPRELVDVGYRAAIRHDRPDIAKAAYRKAADSADPIAAPQAALCLARLHQRAGDLVAATDAYRQALDSRHPDYAPAAALALGGMREDRFDPTGAAAIYQFAVDTGHPDHAPAAALRLGHLRKNRGDLAGAAAAYALAAVSQHAAAARAASLLEDVRRDQTVSDVQTAAMAAVIAAVKTGAPAVNARDPRPKPEAKPEAQPEVQPDAATGPIPTVGTGAMPEAARNPETGPAVAPETRRLTIAAVSVAVPTAPAANGHRSVANTVTMAAVPPVAHRRPPGGDHTDGYMTAFQRSRASAAAIDHTLTTGPAPLANSESMLELGKNRLDQGDVDGALAAWQKVLESGHPENAPAAALLIGSVHSKRGDVDRAAEAYRVAVDSGHPDHAEDAAAQLTSVLEDRDYLEQAAAYRREIESGDPEAAPGAALSLAFLCQSRDDIAGEAAAYQRVIDLGSREYLPIAAYNLGVLRQENGELEEAAAAWRLAIDSGDAVFGPTAAFNLGILRREEDDVEAATAAWRAAVASGDPEYAPAAAVELGTLRRELGDDAGAAADWQFALDSRHPDYAPAAAFTLGVLRLSQGDRVAAVKAWQYAIDSRHFDAAPAAALKLGHLRKQQGDLRRAAACYQLAIDSGHEDGAPEAAIYLGLLLDEHDDLDGAAAAYQVAIDSKHETEAPEAAVRLGLLREKRGDLDGAAEAYRVAAESNHVVYSSDAETYLANLDSGVSNVDEGSAPPEAEPEPGRAPDPVADRDAVAGVPEIFEALDHLDVDEVLSRAFLRVYHRSTIGEADNFIYARPIVGDLVELFVLDSPGAVQIFHRAELERFDRNSLLNASLRNLLAAPIDDYQVFSDNGGQMHVAFGQSVYIASKLLILPDVLGRTVGAAEPPHGVLVCAPNQHELAFHPVIDKSVVPSLQQLSQFALQGFTEGAGPVSPFVYWWQRGRLSQVTRYDDDGQLFIDVDDAFGRVLDELTDGSAS